MKHTKYHSEYGCSQWETMLYFNVVSHWLSPHMMTSSNGTIFRVTVLLCGEFTGHRRIPVHKGPWHGVLMFSLICAWTNSWANIGDTGDLRRHRAHNDIVMIRNDPCTRSLTIVIFLSGGSSRVSGSHILGGNVVSVSIYSSRPCRSCSLLEAR